MSKRTRPTIMLAIDTSTHNLLKIQDKFKNYLEYLALLDFHGRTISVDLTRVVLFFEAARLGG